MLWRKAWLETRSRFFIALAGAVSLCGLLVHHGYTIAIPEAETEYFLHTLAAGHFLLTVMWILSVDLLLMGGLLREKAMGVAPFSLALPVRRSHLLASRIGVGLLQALALAVVPWAAMIGIAMSLGKPYSLIEARFLITLLLCVGSLYFAIALLAASVIEGEYTAPIVSLGIFLAFPILFDGENLRRYNPWALINGTAFLDRHNQLVVGPLPWLQLGCMLLIALCLGALATYSLQHRDF